MDDGEGASSEMVDENDFVPAKSEKPGRHYLIYCDESGMHGSTYYAFGALWMPWERRGDFQKLIAHLRDKHSYTSEIKWRHVKTKPAFYRDLVDQFFSRQWLMFHALVVNRHYVDKKFHKGRIDLAMQKHFTMFLQKRIAMYATPEKRYRVRMDYRQTRFKRADEVTGIIANRQIARELGLRPIDHVSFKDSRHSHGIQLADVLLGCVFSAWQQDDTHRAKDALRARVASYLGWRDLHADTHPNVWKFNVWHFWSPQSGTPRPTGLTRQVSTAFSQLAAKRRSQ